MLLVAVCLASCGSSTPAQLTLMDVHFQNSHDLTRPAAHAGGSLVDLMWTSAMMSKVSVTGSRTGKSLVRGVSSLIQIEKCEYSGLEDTFGSFSQGTVTVSSSTFRNSVRPLIMDTCEDNVHDGANHLQNCEYQGRTEHLGGWAHGLVCDHVEFIHCTSSGNENPGGAIWCELKLSLKWCTFKQCDAENGYGAAVFSQWDGAVEFDHCQVEWCQASYSVVHFQCGEGSGNFPALTMTGNVFKEITIEGGEWGVEGGGSGLVIRHPAKLNLISCEFRNCRITANKEQGGGGALQLYTQTGQAAQYVLEECTFDTTSAAREGGGGLLIRFTGVEGNSLTIIGCQFHDCKVGDTSESFGGCVMTSDGLYTLTMTDTIL